MKLLFTLTLALLCAGLSLTPDATAQQQSAPLHPLQETDQRLMPILEKLGEKARAYREQHTLLLKVGRSKWEYFKDDLKTPRHKPEESSSEVLVVRRPLPGNLSESGLFIIARRTGTDAKGAAKRDADWKDAKAYPFISELDFLLPEKRADFRFSYGGQEDVEGRKAHAVNFVPVAYEAPRFFKQNGQRHFSSAPRKGRILVDTESYDVLRIDWTLIENYQLHLNAGIERKGILFYTRPDIDLKWERWDTALRFKKYTLPNSEQSFWLPESSETFWIVRGARRPVRRASIAFDYRRFQTDVRVLEDVPIADEREAEEIP
jgi:hypothetical protein